MPRSMFRACLAAGLLAISARSFALNPHTLISQYAADHWSTKDGLPQATVSAIAQTTDGYIWLATEEGLVRFDGVRFTVFDSTNSGLTDNYLSGLAASRDGSLWIRTPETLFQYNKARGGGGDVHRSDAQASVAHSAPRRRTGTGR